MTLAPGHALCSIAVLACGVAMAAAQPAVAAPVLLPFGDLRDASNNPWTAATVRATGGQTFTNLDSILPDIFAPGDTLNVSASGVFNAIDPRLNLRPDGIDYAIWNRQSTVSTLTFAFSHSVPLNIQTHDNFTASETVQLDAAGASWIVIDSDLDVGSDGPPIPAGNVSGSGTSSIAIQGVGVSFSGSNNGFVVSSGGAISSFVWTYTTNEAGAAQGPALSIVPEPSGLVLAVLGIAIFCGACRQRKR